MPTQDGALRLRLSLGARLATQVLGVLGGATLGAEASSCSNASHVAAVDGGGTTPNEGGGSHPGPPDGGFDVRRADAKVFDARGASDVGDARTGDAPTVDAGGVHDVRSVDAGRVDARGEAATDGAATRDATAPRGDATQPGDGSVNDAGAIAIDATADADASELITVTSCFTWPVDAGADSGADAGTCPTNGTEVIAIFEAEGCPRGIEPYQFVSGPTDAGASAECCYRVHIDVCGPGGRPLIVDDAPVIAPVVSNARGWSDAEQPRVDGLPRRARDALAAAWAEAAAFEHASIASFARFSLDLMSVGAPPELVASAHAAALDEVRHARVCFALASAYAGHELGPGPLPLGPELPICRSLAALAASTVTEGCIGETIAAITAYERASRASDPVLRSALEGIAADEARHAELAWKTVAWAIRQGGPPVHTAARRAVFEALTRLVDGHAIRAAADRETPVDHGWLDNETYDSVVRAAVDDVILPASRALLGERGSVHTSAVS